MIIVYFENVHWDIEASFVTTENFIKLFWITTSVIIL